MISIIIPVFNVEKYLTTCVNSVLKQTYQNFEIILVDDGSTDNSPNLCDEFKNIDNRIKVIHKSNDGLYSARNCGMEIAKGEYYYFLDSDDTIKESCLETLVTKAKEDNADITIGRFVDVTEQGKQIPRKKIDKLKLNNEELNDTTEKFRCFFGNSYAINACNKLYKVDFIAKYKILFEPNHEIFAEDFLFNLKLFVFEPLVSICNDAIYYYYKREGSIINSYKKDFLTRFNNFYNNYLEFLGRCHMVEKNEDILEFLAFTIFDYIILNDFQNHDSSKKKFIENYYTILKNKEIVNRIVALSSNEFLSKVPRKDWKYFAFLISKCFNRPSIVYFLYRLRNFNS